MQFFHKIQLLINYIFQEVIPSLVETENANLIQTTIQGDNNHKECLLFLVPVIVFFCFCCDCDLAFINVTFQKRIEK
jgi:hypothetical protein